MELSELAAYAAEKYQIGEQHKWADFPGFSALADPLSGKWIALLMSQWDGESGTQVERCDIKCGQEMLLSEGPEEKPYLSAPYRMRGPKWTGVDLAACHEPEVVFALLDRAVELEKESQQGYSEQIYHDTPLPFARQGLTQDWAERRDARIRQTNPAHQMNRKPVNPDPEIPEQIREMLHLYEYGDNTIAGKNRNFVKQAEYMKNYEDNAAWNGVFRRFFPTYHDLNIRQLRGYFTWRKDARKGEYRPIALSLVYIYIYELLNGIGVDGPADVLAKLQDLRIGFLDSGTAEEQVRLAGSTEEAKKDLESLRANVDRWTLEYVVFYGLPVETARQYVDPAILARDGALQILQDPAKYTDEEILVSLELLDGKSLRTSPVFERYPADGVHLAAALWRELTEHFREKDQDIFTTCFGRRRSYAWHPFANAVVWIRERHADTKYVLNPCRMYVCQDGKWQEERYDPLYFNKKKLRGLMHAIDLGLRRYLKTGRYLKEQADEAWVTPYLDRVLEQDRQEKEAAVREAARPKITIDLAGLAKIRADAEITKERLMTEEERGEESALTLEESGAPAAAEEPVLEAEPAEAAETVMEAMPTIAEEPVPAAAPVVAAEPASSVLLDEIQSNLMRALLAGDAAAAADLIRQNHLIPSVVADAINEAFYDEIGDSVLECDGSTITLVEDYREDVAGML